LWPVLQDLAQLQTMYPREGWRTFLSNTAVKIFFGGHGDKETSPQFTNYSRALAWKPLQTGARQGSGCIA
jgi:type IV secretory pathway TraG/TraD family ATPase VirD4